MQLSALSAEKFLVWGSRETLKLVMVWVRVIYRQPGVGSEQRSGPRGQGKVPSSRSLGKGEVSCGVVGERSTQACIRGEMCHQEGAPS